MMTSSARASAGAAAHPSQRRLRLLSLGPQPVWPPTDGGKEGIHGAVAALARQVDLVYACPCPDPTEASREHFRELGVDYRPVPFEVRDTPGVVIASTLQLKPFKFHKYGTRAAVEAFRRAVHDVRPDAILCFHAHMAEMGWRLREAMGLEVPVIVREHNIEYELVDSYRASLAGPRRAAAAPFVWLTRREEQRIWSRADATAFLSDRDHATATATGRVRRAVLAQEGVPLPTRRKLTPLPTPHRLLIPLNPRATQSVLNLKQFLRTHWSVAAPQLRSAGVTLAITGVDGDRLQQMTGFDVPSQRRLGVEALGFLPRLEPALESALALVSPTFVGGGIRKKVLEGMAHQVPVIATDLDIETCRFFDPPRNILRLGTPAEFVATVANLSADAVRWTALAEAGRDTVERHASWDAFAKVIVDEISQLVRSQGESRV